MAIPEEWTERRLATHKPTDRRVTRDEDDRSRWDQKTERFFRLKVTATFTSAHATLDLDIPHKAGAVPISAIPAFPSADVRIWKGDTPWTAGNIYLRASAPCEADIYLVI